jgi:hypothetical protein
VQSLSIIFNPNSNWLFGADFTVLDTLRLGFIFNDPDLYGIILALNGEKAKFLAGLEFEILYKKVTELYCHVSSR